MLLFRGVFFYANMYTEQRGFQLARDFRNLHERAGPANPPGRPQAVQVANPWDVNFGRKLVFVKKSLGPKGTVSGGLELRLVSFHSPFPLPIETDHCDLPTIKLSLITG
jgi:hypothetical protein